jgi:hypothetical protein
MLRWKKFCAAADRNDAEILFFQLFIPLVCIGIKGRVPATDNFKCEDPPRAFLSCNCSPREMRRIGQSTKKGLRRCRAAPEIKDFQNLKILQIIIIKRNEFLGPHIGLPYPVNRRRQGLMGRAVRFIGLLP